MIFAEFTHDLPYGEFHDELVMFLQRHFPDVMSGLQGDSWIWIFAGEDKVEIDTFSAMRHQVKCSSPHSPLLDSVLSLLMAQYDLRIVEPPEKEPHEEGVVDQ